MDEGRGMSGLLLLLVLEWVMSNGIQGSTPVSDVIQLFISKLEDLDFAYDIALISTKFKTIVDKTTIIK